MTRRGMNPQQAAKIREEKGMTMTKLQKVRVEKGYSQSQLAAISGVAIRKIQDYEQKHRQIDIAKLETLCDLSIALDCSIEDLIENKELITKLRLTK